MATQLRSQFFLEVLNARLPIGPWDFSASDTYAEFLGTEIQLPGETLVQIIGGSSPVITYIATINALLLHSPTATIRVGLHGVNAQSAGFTLQAGRTLAMNYGSINALSLYNVSTALSSVIVGIGGS